MSERLMIEKTTVYEIDLECLRRKYEQEGVRETKAREEIPSSLTPSKKEPAR